MSSGPNHRLTQLSGHLEASSADSNDQTRELPRIRQVAGDSASQYVYLLPMSKYHRQLRAASYELVDQYKNRRVKGKVVIITGE